MTETPPQGAPAPPQGAGTGAPSLQIASQYIKDLSFENPGATSPAAGRKPSLQISVDVQVRGLGQDQFEVALGTRAEAKAGEQLIYLCELVYCAVFTIKNVPQDALQPILLVECPRIIFPFARRIIADVTRDGGFMPLMLDPIDFAALYRQKLSGQRPQQGENAGV